MTSPCSTKVLYDVTLLNLWRHPAQSLYDLTLLNLCMTSPCSIYVWRYFAQSLYKYSDD